MSDDDSVEREQESVEDDTHGDSTEERVCPNCDRPVAMKSRASCAYCGTPLPWVSESADETQPDVDIVKLLTDSEAEQPVTGATYPVACGACGEKLPETKPQNCPNCHAMVRDPFTGRLVYGDVRPAESTSITKIIAAALLLFALTGATLVLYKLFQKLPVP